MIGISGKNETPFWGYVGAPSFSPLPYVFRVLPEVSVNRRFVTQGYARKRTVSYGKLREGS